MLWLPTEQSQRKCSTFKLLWRRSEYRVENLGDSSLEFSVAIRIVRTRSTGIPTWSVWNKTKLITRRWRRWNVGPISCTLKISDCFCQLCNQLHLMVNIIAISTFNCLAENNNTLFSIAGVVWNSYATLSRALPCNIPLVTCIFLVYAHSPKDTKKHEGIVGYSMVEPPAGLK